MQMLKIERCCPSLNTAKLSTIFRVCRFLGIFTKSFSCLQRKGLIACPLDAGKKRRLIEDLGLDNFPANACSKLHIVTK